MKTLLSLLLALTVSSALAATRASFESQVQAALAELGQLKPMRSGQRYTLPASGTSVTGANDDFLRRRTAREVAESGLSCGCGDYALVFLERMKAQGAATLLVDSAQISFLSLATTYAGHTVVAVRPADEPTAPWWLVDSTARTILSRAWSPEATWFAASGQIYWIGYCGPAEAYPARSPAELRAFYRETLAKVPAAFFNRHLYRFTFTLDPSLRDEQGTLRNPRVTRLAEEQDRLLAKYRIEPERTVAILLTRGADDGTGDLRLQGERWVGRVGLKSACSPSFLTYMERTVRRAEK